jgi:hypothetical protein
MLAPTKGAWKVKLSGFPVLQLLKAHPSKGYLRAAQD